MKLKLYSTFFLFIYSFCGYSQIANDSLFHPPEFGNEESEFYVYIENSLNTNPDIKSGTQNGQQVTIQFVVDTTGRPVRIDISNTADLFLITQLKTAIERMPDWTPAVKNGLKIDAVMIYHINVRYDGAGHFVVDKAKLLPPLKSENLALKQSIIGCTLVVFIFYIIGVIVN